MRRSKPRRAAAAVKDYARNGAWLRLAALAVSLNAWLRLIALDGELATAEPKTLRFRLFAAPGPPGIPRLQENPEDPEALAHLPELSTPADTLALWQTWLSRLETLGPDHPDTLTTWNWIADLRQQIGEES